jgi:hypothetical protein
MLTPCVPLVADESSVLNELFGMLRTSRSARHSQSGRRPPRHVQISPASRTLIELTSTPERRRRSPDSAELSDPRSIGGIPKDSRSRQPQRPAPARLAAGRGAERTTKRLPSCSISVSVSESRSAMICGPDLVGTNPPPPLASQPDSSS